MACYSACVQALDCHKTGAVRLSMDWEDYRLANQLELAEAKREVEPRAPCLESF
jgi:hypothetical protein